MAINKANQCKCAHICKISKFKRSACSEKRLLQNVIRWKCHDGDLRQHKGGEGAQLECKQRCCYW